MISTTDLRRAVHGAVRGALAGRNQSAAPPARQLVRKYYALPRAAGPDEDGILITTMDVDFEADRVFPEGADLELYLRNPVVLWLHDAYGHTASAGIPIGTTRSLEIIPGKGIRATGVDWLEGDEFADRVRNAWAQGKIRGASIGFLPIEARPNTHGGYDHLRWKLLEWSLVPIPANPTAIRRVGRNAVAQVLAKWIRPARPVDVTLVLDPSLLLPKSFPPRPMEVITKAIRQGVRDALDPKGARIRRAVETGVRRALASRGSR